MPSLSCTWRALCCTAPIAAKGALPACCPARLTVPRDLRGQRIPLPEVGLVMNRRMARLMHVRVGDRLTVQPIRGERRPVETPVMSIADGYMGLAVYARIDYLSRLVGEELAISDVQLVTDASPQGRRELYRQLKQLPGVRSVNVRADVIRNLIETLLETQYLFLGIWVLFAGVLFFGSVLNASLVSLAERQREVATFVALGYTRWQVGAMFMRESMLVNTAGTLLGLPVGYGLAQLMVYAYANDMLRLPLVSAVGLDWGDGFCHAVCPGGPSSRLRADPSLGLPPVAQGARIGLRRAIISRSG